ncbi:MAG: hypothetical protein CMF52_08545 [Legionellales bacterium]|nr:hypothetical protein [Legionellales bacterium]
MADGERLLSEEEIDAIGDVVASGELSDGYNMNVETTPFELVSDLRKDGFDSSLLEPINERLIRHFRILTKKELNYQIEITAGKIETSNYDDLIQEVSVPASVNLTRIAPLKGDSLVILDSGVIDSCVDAWFGGGQRVSSFDGAERQLSETEKLVAKKMRIGIYAALIEAWAPSLEVQCELVQSESEARLVDVTDPSIIFVVNRFLVSQKDQSIGEIKVVYPLESIKLLRGTIVVGPETKIQQNRLEKIWSTKLREALHQVPFEAVVQAGEIPLPLGELKELKVGDTIPLKDLQESVMKVNGLGLFDVEIGSRGSNTAIKILSARNEGLT